MQLNEQQEEAANHRDGPCLVTAVPGSGKTRLLVERVGRMVSEGVNPKQIVCVTFTNKAASEMKERICERLQVTAPEIYVGTFHKMCVKLLRKFGSRLGYTEKFTIADSDDQIDMITQVARQKDIAIERKEVRVLAKHINDWRENIWSEEDFFEKTGNNTEWTEVAEGYLNRLKASNMIDFSGLLSECIELFQTHNDCLQKVQNAFKYMQVDECQDCNVAQFVLIKMFSAKWRNVMLVGDISQCVHPNTKIIRDKISFNASEIIEGDFVLSAIGGCKTGYSKVERVKKVKSDGLSCEISTHLGKKMTCSLGHIVFAGYNKYCPQKRMTYLMDKQGLGFRIGCTSILRSANTSYGHSTCFASRLNANAADRMWFLTTHDSVQDALVEEQIISSKYGIPQWVFKTSDKKRSVINDQSIEKLYRSLDTASFSKKLSQDFNLNLSYPHYEKVSINQEKPRNATLTLLSHSGCAVHSLQIFGMDMSEGYALEKAGLPIKKRKNSGWRLSIARKDLSEIDLVIKKCKEVVDINVQERARLGRHLLPYCPASNLRPGMMIYSLGKDHKVVEDFVQEVKIVPYDGEWIDFDINRTRNIVTDGIFSKNSIYKFRGARHQNVTDFIRENKDCRLIELPINYRSTPQIVKAADTLIRKNSSHIGDKFETVNPDGHPVKVLPFRDQENEAEFVAKQSKKLIDAGWKPGDIAVLYRINSLSEPVERAMANRRVPYKVVGGRSFYDRKEIKDCIAMLRFAVNPKDGIAFHRCAKLMNGVGDTTIGKIETLAMDNDMTMLAAAKQFTKGSSSKIKTKVEKLIECFDIDYSSKNVAQTLEAITENFSYSDILEKQYADEAGDRIDNVQQMLNSAAEFAEDKANKNTTVEYLQMITLVTTNDERAAEETVSLMSMHASKGLEFPVVFMIGIEADVIPHNLAISDDPIEGVEEERRLCYVAMTRAKHALYISYCRSRKMYVRGGKGGTYHKPAKPSKFIKEAGLVEAFEHASI